MQTKCNQILAPGRYPLTTRVSPLLPVVAVKTLIRTDGTRHSMGKKHLYDLRPGRWRWLTCGLLCTWASYALCKITQAWHDQATPEFGFILTRCVRNGVHDKYWQESHRCIRRLFPDSPVIIIDDHSDKAFLSDSYRVDKKTGVLASPFPPGRGEGLPYY